MFDPEALIKSLYSQHVNYVIIGGIAARIHGGAHPTEDFDVCYERSNDNIEAVVRAIAPLHPRLRGKNLPENLPFVFDQKTLKMGLNFTLLTDSGPMDLLGEVKGIGAYAECISGSETLDLYGVPCCVLTLDALIVSKRAAARLKDQPVILELEAIREMKGR